MKLTKIIDTMIKKQLNEASFQNFDDSKEPNQPKDKIELIARWIVATYPLAGSFSTYIAATSLDRICITTELHEEYYKRGMERLKFTKTENNFF